MRAKNRIFRDWYWQTIARIAGAALLIVAICLSSYSPADAVSTATLVPDGDIASGWSSIPSGSHYTAVDDGTTDNTTDYVQALNTDITSSLTDTYSLNNQTAVLSASQIVLRIYAKSATFGNGGALDTISLNLSVNGVWQTAVMCTPPYGTWTACTATFNGSWTQADVNSMQVQIIRNIEGNGKTSSKTDTVQVANIYGALTYVPSITYTQSAYRWFGNQDLPSPITFANTYGNSDYDRVRSVVQTTDGGFVMTGQIRPSEYNFDMFLAKYDSTGTLSWIKTWGGGNADNGLSVIQTSDGGYAVTGITESFSDPTWGDMLLVKYDSGGTVTWSKTLGFSGTDQGNSVVQTSDGGYAITGTTGTTSAGSYSDMFLAKYDSSGTLSWSKKWGDATTNDGNSVVQTSDGGYAITGTTGATVAASYSDIFLVKYDNGGSLSWAKSWGGTGDDVGVSILQTDDGGYVIAGHTSSFGVSQYDVLLAKFDSTGENSWSKTWGKSSDDRGKSVIRTVDGGYAVAGYTTGYATYGAGSADMLLIKYDSNGALLFNKLFGGTESDIAYSLAETGDGGYAVAGTTSSFGAGNDDMLLVRYDSDGSISGCGSPLCQTPSATTTSPINSSINSSIISNAITGSAGAPSASITSSTRTTTSLVAVAPSPAIVDVSSALAAQDTAAIAPNEGAIFRLRMDIHLGGMQLSSNTTLFKLQFALKTGYATCSTVPNINYVSVSHTSSGIRYADNINAGSGLNFITNAGDPKHGTDTNVNQTYLEKGTSTFTNTAAIPADQDGMWDFALTTYQPVQNASYCFRIVESNGTPLTTYSQFPEIQIVSTPPSIDFVDGSGNVLTSPTFSLSAKNFLTTCQTSTGTLGNGSTSKLRVTQSSSADNGWNVSISPSSGDSALWSSGSGNWYDFNDSSGAPAGCFAGSDGDTYAGQLTLSSGSAVLTPKSGCSNTGLSLASGSSAFTSGSVSAITLLTASSAATSGCYWDITGIGLSQTIPPNQPAGAYTINLTATVTSS